jgi:hypothetical protein
MPHTTYMCEVRKIARQNFEDADQLNDRRILHHAFYIVFDWLQLS